MRRDSTSWLLRMHYDRGLRLTHQELRVLLHALHIKRYDPDAHASATGIPREMVNEVMMGLLTKNGRRPRILFSAGPELVLDRGHVTGWLNARDKVRAARSRRVSA